MASDALFDLGRNVFSSAVSAVVDDFSMLPAEHLQAAINYGSEQLILPRRAKRVLSLLKKELEDRSGGKLSDRQKLFLAGLPLDGTLAVRNARLTALALIVRGLVWEKYRPMSSVFSYARVRGTKLANLQAFFVQGTERGKHRRFSKVFFASSADDARAEARTNHPALTVSRVFVADGAVCESES